MLLGCFSTDPDPNCSTNYNIMTSPMSHILLCHLKCDTVIFMGVPVIIYIDFYQHFFVLCMSIVSNVLCMSIVSNVLCMSIVSNV